MLLVSSIDLQTIIFKYAWKIEISIGQKLIGAVIGNGSFITYRKRLGETWINLLVSHLVFVCKMKVIIQIAVRLCS